MKKNQHIKFGFSYDSLSEVTAKNGILQLNNAENQISAYISDDTEVKMPYIANEIHLIISALADVELTFEENVIWKDDKPVVKSLNAYAIHFVKIHDKWLGKYEEYQNVIEPFARIKCSKGVFNDIVLMPLMSSQDEHYFTNYKIKLVANDKELIYSQDDIVGYCNSSNQFVSEYSNKEELINKFSDLLNEGENEIEIYGSKSLEQGGIRFAPYTTEVNYLKFAPVTCNRMFYDCGQLTKIDLSNLDTKKVIDMYMMFAQCKVITTLDVSKFDTHCVRNMNNMFRQCWALTTLDVSNFNTINVKDMGYMFYQCNVLTSLDVSKWNTQNVTNMSNMFSNCVKIAQLELNNWDVKNVTNMNSMFNSCKMLTSLDLNNWNTGNVTNMMYMFSQCRVLAQLNISKWNVSNVTTMSNMLEYCSALTELDINNWDVRNVTTMYAMFKYCTQLQIVHTSNWKLSKINSMALMFSNCTLLTDVDTDNWNMSNVTTINSMFANCMNLQNININNWKFNQQVTANGVFTNCNTLSQIDMSNWNMNKITAGDSIFVTCNNLTNIKVNTINNTTLAMFDSLPTLTGKKGIIEYKSTEVELPDLSSKGYSFLDVGESKLIAKLTTNTNSINGMPFNVILEDKTNNVEYIDKYKIQLVINGTVVSYTQEDIYTYINSSNMVVSKFLNDNIATYTKSFLIEGQENEILVYASKEVECGGVQFGNGLTKIEIIDFKPATCCHMFANCKTLSEIDLHGLDTRNVTNMAYMFKDCQSLTELDLSNFDTRNVTNMSNMFQNCYALTQLDVSNFDTRHVTNMKMMFYNCYALTELNVSNFDTRNVTDMSNMFQNCKSLTELNVDNFITNKVTSINNMFNGCIKLTEMNLNRLNTKSLQYANYVFKNCTMLEKVDISKLALPNNCSTTSMFDNCTNLIELDINTINSKMIDTLNALPTLVDKKGVIKYKKSNVELPDLSSKGYSFLDISESKLIAKLTTNTVNIIGTPVCVIMGDSSTNIYQYMDKYKIQLVVNGTVVSYTQEDVYSYIDGNFLMSYYLSNNVFPQVKSLLIEGQENEILVYASKEVEHGGVQFGNGLTKIEIIDFKPVTCHNMFMQCANLTEIDLHGLNTSNVTDMFSMFHYCKSLTELDVSNLDTKNVTNMAYMFKDCSKLTELNLSNFDTRNVTTMAYMFMNDSKLTELDLNNFNTSKVEYMNNMFNGCSGLTKLAIDKWDVHKCKDMTLMLKATSKLTTLDFSKWDVPNLQIATSMFYNCGIDLDSFYSLNTNNAININGILYGYPLKNQVDYSKVRDKRGINLSYFYENATNVDLELIKPYMSECGSLFNTFRGVKVSSLDLSDLDTSHVQDMSEMFSNCSNLKTLNITNINTSNVTNMKNMFYNCSALTELDVNNFDTRNVTNMAYMFYGCSALTELDVSNFDTRNVTDMSYMFYGCSTLTELDVSNFDTRNVTDMSGMFNSCSILTQLDVSNFDTKNVTSMSYMFNNCAKIVKLDISKWDLQNINIIKTIFANCTALEELNIGKCSFAHISSLSNNITLQTCTSLTHIEIDTIDETMAGILTTLPTLVDKKGVIKYKQSNVELPDLSSKGYEFAQI